MPSGPSDKPTSFSPKIYWREILALLMLLLAIVFFRSERKELYSIGPRLQHANTVWVIAGIVLTSIYILLQGGIYKQSFACIGLRLSWLNAIIVFLKRNFLSVFLPAGGVSALAYSPSQIRRAGFSKIQIHQASGLFGFVGLLTVFIVGLPVALFSVLGSTQFKNAWIGLVVLMLVIALLLVAVRSFRRKGKLFIVLEKKIPSIAPTVNELFAANVQPRKFTGAVIYSMGVELCGIIHIYIAMLALGTPASLGTAAIAYITAVLMMVISPFLKGLGAVELSMVYVLERSGYNSAQALSVAVLYRLFEFWLPLLCGLIAFAWKGRKIFFRAAPALLTFCLGIVNIISVVTPPLQHRMRLLKEYLPLSTIHASNLLVLFIGLSLLVTAAFLFRGLRMAWIIALGLSLVSLMGHLTKALDYEEAIIAAITAITLIGTASQYRIQSSNKWMRTGLQSAIASFAAVSLFSFISFYFIDIRHFGIDFTWQQSLIHTVKVFLLVNDGDLHPITRFGHEFIWLVRVLGFLTWGFLLFSLIKPGFHKQTNKEDDRKRAAFIIDEFGDSAMDYFKLSSDKIYFFSELHEGLIAYRTSGGFAIVLEEPVCAEENKIEVVQEFDQYCRKKGLKPAFYRVNEDSTLLFMQLKKNKLVIGQEAILDISQFTLEGKDRKSLRNGLSSLQKKGFTIVVHPAPHVTGFISQLEKISNEWLASFDVDELIFSQGMFDKDELAKQDIITIEDENHTIKAFLNIIPDYAEDECTYDLIRKADDAPAAAMDALIVKLIGYAKDKGLSFLNLGLVPMTGIDNPENTAEQIIKLAAAKIRRFQHYKGLREFKEKYATIWENKYLIYDNDFDLLQLPIAINNVMKP